MVNTKLGVHTVCTHTGEIKDTQFGGAVSPIFMASSYPFLDVEVKRYPRYFNNPNQQAAAAKIAALEHAEAGLVFASGMAAISTTLLAFLNKGDHIVLQNQIYGGAFNFVVEEFDKMGIEYSFTEGLEASQFEEKIKSNTKVLYMETPTNPLLSVVDLNAVGAVAKNHGLISMIDNTFASPINLTPRDFGIDIVLHSATKYLSGHSDMCAGAVAASETHIEQIFQKSKNLGGSMSDFMCYLLERSMKTLAIRVEKHNKNAVEIASWLAAHKAIANVYHPSLRSHPNHEIAKEQMNGFGGMLSFELTANYDAKTFLKKLQLIKPSMSLAGVESTMLLPSETSHALLTPEQRAAVGISDNLIRFSVGIEDVKDLQADIEQALTS